MMILRRTATETTTPLAGVRRDAFQLPADITEWADAADLRRWIVEEIETLNWANLELERMLRANPAFQPKMLLCLLIYAYACGVYDAEEVSRLTLSREVRAEFKVQTPPAPRAITHFRRENRGLIRWGLVQVLKRVVKARYLEHDPYFPPGLKRHLVQVATTRLEIARMMIRGSEEA